MSSVGTRRIEESLVRYVDGGEERVDFSAELRIVSATLLEKRLTRS